MIDPEDRFFADSQSYYGRSENPKTEAHCRVWDWDQLRLIKIKGTAKVLRPEEEVQVSVVQRFIDYLSPDVHAITLDDDGLLTGLSTDPEDDDTPYLPYLPLSMFDLPRVDLSCYADETGATRTVAFKFNPMEKPLRLQMAWDELHLLTKLPPHPNITPFDRVVLDDGDVELRVLGFTTKYISGGSIDNATVPLRFEWLRQLTRLNILLFDFDRAAIGKKRLSDGRDDVAGVAFTMYELITGDTQFASIPHWERTIDSVQNADLSEFRKSLDGWIAKRRTDEPQSVHMAGPSNSA
ncbi:hypothetical protein BDW69DRAFT_193246 [Aspergillus filifer]